MQNNGLNERTSQKQKAPCFQGTHVELIKLLNQSELFNQPLIAAATEAVVPAFFPSGQQ